MSAIHVIAGVNGAGKSSIAGAALREAGGDYYNPDEAARKIKAANPVLSQTEANSAAWNAGVRLLRQAIDQRLDFIFESTLGANTIPALLGSAALKGIEVHVWFVGLSNVESHLARVRHRVSRGGHDIAEADVRRRYEHSRLNLIELLPLLASLCVFDNSIEADPAAGRVPKPLLVLHLEKDKIIKKPRIVGPRDLTPTPDWARPIVAAAIKLSTSQ